MTASIKAFKRFIRGCKPRPAWGEFAAEQVSRVPAIELTQAMILLVVKLLNDLYGKPVRH